MKAHHRCTLLAWLLAVGAIAQAGGPLEQGKAVTIRVGQLVDAGDYSAAEDLEIEQAAVRLSKNNGAAAQKSDASAATHDENGFYRVPLNATDTNTVGTLVVEIKVDGVATYRDTFTVYTPAVYRTLFDAGAAGPATAIEARSIAQSTTDALVYTPVGGKTGVRDLCGRLPVPGAADYETLVRAVAATWRRLCPAAQTTTYWFDAQNGSDSNDGLSSTTPKQTISAMNTLLASGNCRLRLKGTWRHAASSGIVMDTTKNVSLTRWEDGSAYRITGCRIEANAGTVTWTLAAGNRYSATIANAAHLHPKSWGVFHYLKCAASTAEVEANAYSYYITGSTVHVNMGGADPNTIDFECTHTGDWGSTASGVSVSGASGGVFIEGGTFDHNGYGAYATGTNQSYGVVMTHTSEAVVYLRDCQFAAHFYHSVGTLSNSGGRTLLENCVAGGGRDNTHTKFNFFSTNGGNEAICLQCRVVTDRMPRVGMSAVNAQAGFFSHTAGAGAKVSFLSMIECELTPGGQDPPQLLGRFADCPTLTADPASYVATFYRCRTTPTIASRTIPWLNEAAYVNCDIHIRPAQIAGLYVTNLGAAGMCLGTEFTVDWQDITPGASDMYGLHESSTVATVNPRIINSVVRFVGTQSGRKYGINRHNTTTTPAINNTAVTIINSLFTSDSLTTGSVCWVSLGDVLTVNGTKSNNASHGFAVGGTGDYGTSTWANHVYLDTPVAKGRVDERLVGRGNQTLAPYAETDPNGRPLLLPGANIGPWGRLAGDYDQEWRFSLSPSQLAKLEAASLALPAASYTAPPSAATIRGEFDGDFDSITDAFGDLNSAVSLLPSASSTATAVWANGTRTITTTIPSASDIRTEIDTNSTKLASILEDTAAIVTPLDATATQEAAEAAIEAKLAEGATHIAGAGTDAKTLDDVALDEEQIGEIAEAVAGEVGSMSGGNVLQHDVDPGFTFELPSRVSGVTRAKRSIYLSSREERPRFAFDTSRLTNSKPAAVTSVEVLTQAGATSNAIEVADEDDTANTGVRDWLVMSKIKGVAAAGTYVVRITFVAQDTSVYVVEGEVVAP